MFSRFHNIKYADHSHTKRCNFASEVTGNNLLSCVIRSFPQHFPNIRASALLREKRLQLKIQNNFIYPSENCA